MHLLGFFIVITLHVFVSSLAESFSTVKIRPVIPFSINICMLMSEISSNSLSVILRVSSQLNPLMLE